MGNQGIRGLLLVSLDQLSWMDHYLGRDLALFSPAELGVSEVTLGCWGGNRLYRCFSLACFGAPEIRGSSFISASNTTFFFRVCISGWTEMPSSFSKFSIYFKHSYYHHHP